MGKYDHMLSPIRIGNRLFKNRIIMTPTTTKFMQNGETYPTDATMQHYLLRAKNGAAMVTLSGLSNTAVPVAPARADCYSLDLYGEGGNHYLAQLAEGIHGYGSYVTIQLMQCYPETKDIYADAKPFFDAAIGQWRKQAIDQLTEDDLKAINEDLVEKCLILKKAGIDGVCLHMSYNLALLGRSLSPITNRRTDKYGGSFENRIRLAIETCDAIKGACGKDFLIEAHMTGEERDANGVYIPGGWSADDTVRFAEAMSGKLDILAIRGADMDANHALWFQPDTTPNIEFTERCMEAVTETKILLTSGNKNPDDMDAVIAEGKADLLGMARQLIADPNFVQKLYEDRADDIRPCIHCNRCFNGTAEEPRTNRCTVNPMWGFEHRANMMFTPPERQKKIVVAGGGPAGMEAAYVASRRGHDVTLYEKAEKLGGQLNTAAYSEKKWALRAYRDYLIHQMDKLGVDVHVGEALTPEMVEEGGYDAVIAAVGSRPSVPPIQGIDDSRVCTVFDVYGHEEELGERVVIIGGGTTAMETGLHLADDFGLEVTVLELADKLARDTPPVHCRSVMEQLWASCEKLSAYTNAAVSAITEDGVVYTDAEGAEHVVAADTIIVATGMVPLMDEAMSFHGHGAQLITVGDSQKPGSILSLTRNAWFGTMQL